MLDNDVARRLDKVAKYRGQGNVTTENLQTADISAFL